MNYHHRHSFIDHYQLALKAFTITNCKITNKGFYSNCFKINFSHSLSLCRNAYELRNTNFVL